MGAGQSGGMAIEGSSMGYQVLRVYPDSPGSRAGLKAYFDFIIAIGNTRFNKENGSLREILKASVDQKLKMIVFNTRTKKGREVEIVPSTSWGGNGLLGVSIKHTSFDRADERVWHVVEVEPGSPAQQAGFRANEDYVVGSDSILQENDDLYNLIEAHDGKALKLFVYNANTDNCRDIVCHPNSKWGGKGYLGCEFGHGLLHRIPYSEVGESQTASLLRNEQPIATQLLTQDYNKPAPSHHTLLQEQVKQLQMPTQPGNQLFQQALFDYNKPSQQQYHLNSHPTQLQQQALQQTQLPQQTSQQSQLQQQREQQQVQQPILSFRDLPQTQPPQQSLPQTQMPQQSLYQTQSPQQTQSPPQQSLLQQQALHNSQFQQQTHLQQQALHQNQLQQQREQQQVQQPILSFRDLQQTQPPQHSLPQTQMPQQPLYQTQPTQQSLQQTQLPQQSLQQTQSPPQSLQQSQLPPQSLQQTQLPPQSLQQTQLPPQSLQQTQYPQQSQQQTQFPQQSQQQTQLPQQALQQAQSQQHSQNQLQQQQMEQQQVQQPILSFRDLQHQYEPIQKLDANTTMDACQLHQ